MCPQDHKLNSLRILFLKELILAGFLCSSLTANTYWVSTTGNDSSAGSQTYPFATIHQALSVIQSLDTIRVLPGVYFQQINVEDLAGVSDFVLQGYPAGEIISISSPITGPVLRLNQPFTRQTRIENIWFSHQDTLLEGVGIELNATAITMDGCTIFNNHSAVNGGGIRILNSGVPESPLIINCRIYANKAPNGAGIYAENSALSLEHCSLEDNTTIEGNGGGLALIGCFDSEIYYNQFHHNQAGRGAGIYLDVASVPQVRANSFLNNLIYLNSASSAGAGMFLSGNAVSNTIFDNTFAENHAAENGGGLSLSSVSNIILNKNIIVNNTSGLNGAGIHLQNLSGASVDFWSNQISGNMANGFGGGIYLENCNNVTVGGAVNLQNNLYHNRAQGTLNAIHSATTISNLNLDYNFWGFKEISAVQLQISIPGSNLSGLPFEQNPRLLSQSLIAGRSLYYFGDGFLQFQDEAMLPTGSDFLEVFTQIDTSIITGTNLRLLNKSYTISLSGNQTDMPWQLSLYYDQSELENAGNPALNMLEVISFDETNMSWSPEPSTVQDLKNFVTANLTSFIKSKYGIGFLTQPVDTSFNVFPAQNKTDVESEVNLEIHFQTALNPASIDTHSVVIDGQYSGLHSFDQFYDVHTNTLFIRPWSPFVSSEEVTVSLTSSILDVASNPFSEGFSWQFHIASFGGNAQFLPKEVSKQRNGSKKFLLAEMNGDHFPDLVELSQTQIIIFRNNQLAEFLASDSLQLGGSYDLIAISDLDNDGKKEIIVGNNTQIQIIQYSPAGGDFGIKYTESLIEDGTLIDFAVADFDNDGDKDLCLLRDLFFNYQIDFYQSSLATGFVLNPTTNNILAGAPGKLAIADVNGDGFIDIVANGGSGQDNLTLLLNKQGLFTRIFTTTTDVSNLNGFLTANVWQQKPYDRQREVVISGMLNTEMSSGVGLFNLNEGGQLTLLSKTTLTSAVNDLVTADVTSDGIHDIVVCLNAGGIQILSTKDQFIAQSALFNADIYADRLLTADLDLDGDVDLIALNQSQSDSRWQVLENRSRLPRSFWVDYRSTGGTGDQNSPFPQINEALKRIIGADSIFVFGGPYQEHLLIEKNLVLKSYGSEPITLIAPQLTAFDSAQIAIRKVKKVHLSDVQISRDKTSLIEDGSVKSVGLQITQSDTVFLNSIAVNGPDIGLQVNSCALFAEGLKIENCDIGFDALNAQTEACSLSLTNNRFSAAQFDASKIIIKEANIFDNAFDPVGAVAGLFAENNSEVELSFSEISKNGKSNLMFLGSNARLRFCGIFDAYILNEQGTGSGIFAENVPEFSVRNTFIAGNQRHGIYIRNGQADIQNNIFGKNDSLFSLAGAGLNLEQSSTTVVNNIFALNNTGIRVNGGLADINYNDFFSNQVHLLGSSLGVGNISEDPLFVSEYQIPGGVFIRPDSGFDAFAFKLSPGSPLLDRGDPSILNEDSSRSDIGLFGNLGLPFTLNERPRAMVDNQDSLLHIRWNVPDLSLDSLFSGTALFRSEQAGFVPDTNSFIGFLNKTLDDYQDRDLQYGVYYYYRLAFVDIHGGTSGYSDELNGRIDFVNFTFNRPAEFVQLGQNDTLRKALTVRNGGTLPIRLQVVDDLPAWLNIFPMVRNITPADSGIFLLRFSAEGLPQDTLLEHSLTFIPEGLPEDSKTFEVQMLVSYRDLFPPLTRFRGAHPDTVLQSILRFSFSGDDSTFGTVGTPDSLLRYQYSLEKITNGDTSAIDQQTIHNNHVRFYPLKDGRYLFRVAALDTVNRGGLNSASEIKKEVEVRAGPTIVLRNVWQMISPSRNLNDFSKFLFNDQILAVKHWDHSEYIDVQAADLKFGQSYWIISKETEVANWDGMGFLREDTLVTVELEEGWNQIGNPWSWNIGWDSCAFIDRENESYFFNEALALDWLRAEIYYNEILPFRRYERVKSNILLPKVGYWFYANQALTLRFTARPQVLFDINEIQSTRTLHKPGHSKDVLVHLKAYCGSYADVDNYYGLCENLAAYEQLYWSALEPPAIGDYLRLYHRSENRAWSSSLIEVVKDQAVKEWDLILERRNTAEALTLTWDWISGPEVRQLFLYHLESGQWFNLAERNVYTIENKESLNHLKLYATDNALFSPKVLPLKFELAQNYPNPFNIQTTIELAVPYFADNQQVDLTIYDVLGCKVRTLVNRRLSSGYQKIIWDGKNDSGRLLASGLYILHVNTQGFTASRKLILIK